MTHRTTAVTGRGIMRGVFFFIAGLAAYCILLAGISDAMSDRIIAFVDDQAITLRELDDSYKAAKALSNSITREEVLNTMINRVILLREAKKYRLEAPTVDGVVKEFIDLKIRAFIMVNDADIEKFYKANMQNFQGREYEDVRDEIDLYLTEKLLNERLKETLNDLRKKAYIRIYLNTE
jgi:hypothetical protein